MIEIDQLAETERMEHERWMREAIIEANEAEVKGEVPIGAIIVQDGQIIARAHNLRELTNRATGHAEMLVIDQANQHLAAWRLEHATLYVTLEPCPMCAGALIMSRVKEVVYGAADPKAGCAGSLMNLLEDARFNHQPRVVKGVLADECGQQLTEFFRGLRRRNKARRQNKDV